jgi:hypothetical protein
MAIYRGFQAMIYLLHSGKGRIDGDGRHLLSPVTSRSDR